MASARRLSLAILMGFVLVGCTEETEMPPRPRTQRKLSKIDQLLEDLRHATDNGYAYQESRDALAAMGPAVVPRLRKELDDPDETDQNYRSHLIIVLGHIPGSEAFEALENYAGDEHPNVRVNALLHLSRRAKRNPSEREAAVSILLSAVATDPHPQVRTFVTDRISRYPKAAWTLILCLRETQTDDGTWRKYREACLRSLRKISGRTEQQLPFDLEGDTSEHLAGIRRWEVWYTSTGRVIPKGQDLDSQLRR